MRPIFQETDLNERPFLVFWEVTRACALACQHCRATAQPHAHPNELTHDEAIQLIDQLAALHPPMLVLTGGDPMMRRDLYELIRYAANQGLHVALSPAATARLLHADFNELREAGVKSMSLSLDGANEATHDAFRGVPHTFERTLEAARRAKAAGLHLQINTTITKSTLDEFDAFVALMKEMQPDMWSVFLLVPTGRASMDEMPTAEQVECVWKRLAEVSKEVSFGVKTTEGHHYRRVALQEAKTLGEKPARKAIPTRDGKGIMFISHTGDIQPSGFLPMTAGNVRTDNIADIYRYHELFHRLRDDNALMGKCGRCEYRTICGGSRSRAFAVYGDAFAEDNLCSYQPRHS
ncbi:MAG: radical SAM protein [Akkermansia sp.]